MINITLQDGSVRSFNSPVTGFTIAENISKSLGKKAIAIGVNGVIKDLSHTLNDDAIISIITEDSIEALDIVRHSAAHILAQAVKKLYPDVQVTIGPVVENGFYYDFVRTDAFTTDDLIAIESEMRSIVKQNEKITRVVMTRAEAIKYFQDKGENYKVEIIKDIPAHEELSVYFQGDFADLCRGPHCPSTGKVKAFKLMKVAGAYWRGDSKNQMLQRIYGTAFSKEEQLQEYLNFLEEAKLRDHRKIGQEMGLFHLQEEAPGAVFWHPKGWTLFQLLVNYMREKQNAAGYNEISTPEIIDRSLWEKSGHWEKFSENMFTASAADERTYAVRPMNCPGGVQVFKCGLTSYKDLPLRLSEFGKVHRYEPSGALHGLMRVRAFTQDDAHIFCTPEQMHEECLSVCRLVLSIYRDFGFKDVRIKLSDRPSKRIGSDESWDNAETALLAAIQELNLDYVINSGEGAFYGPKIEFVLKDAIGRDWQLGTLQVDFNLPYRLGASYIGQDGQKHTPVMLHRAVFGSLERFIGILLEHYIGKLPIWLAPIQVVIATVSSSAENYAEEVFSFLREHKIRAILDSSAETLGYKVRLHSLAKVPVILTIGNKEAVNRTVCMRRLGEDSNIELSLDDFMLQFIEMSNIPR
ncbi:threonine--tRNA ligase [Candidatus Lariskella endosymbiont of Epinotia ramella]|uniref:threonine--tRNA ligase n=1 Tax=Candidatus Lariskella endosymbiont of Epinotia ramella TaxID=3066224 RepID=UPI0030D60B20